MPNRMYVGNLPYSIKESDLANFFASAGKVEKTSIVIDRDTGKPRGFGFVDMSSAEEMKKAIETLNGADMQGRPLVVNEARPKEDRPHAGGPRPHSGGPRPNRGNGGEPDYGSSRSGGGRPKFDDHRSGGGRSGRNDWRNERRESNRRGFDEQY